MKNILPLIIVTLLMINFAYSQEDLESVTAKPKVDFINHFIKELKKDSKNFHTDDIYNPINFTTIEERMPASNGKISSYEILNRGSLDYIKRGSEVHIEFDKNFVYNLTKKNELELQVIAYIIRKDKTIKPLEVNGFTEVTEDFKHKQLYAAGRSTTAGTDIVDVKEDYKVKFLKSKETSFSAEVKLVWEEISVDDKIIITVQNKKNNNVGFSTTLVFDDFGWQQKQIGGLSFVQTSSSNSNFVPAGTIGYSFRYIPRRSGSFGAHFFSPGFGPELNVYQTEDNTTNIGLGIFATTAYDIIKLGVGFNLNGTNSGKAYFGIGLNFVKTFNVVSGLLDNTKSTN
ncbi:conserved protein of unknown function [Tenacibaculum sp. 190524A02b]|uniref:hypothetical protein n=1 Tax=Tenacibaculum vairaonense TaxID=3137860 RepID=UPI0032B1383D